MASSKYCAFAVVAILFLFSFACHPLEKFSTGIEERRWPNAVIHYKIQANLSQLQIKNITLAIHEIESQSCIKFQPFQGQRFYMEILSKSSNPEFPQACYVDNIGRNNLTNEHYMHLGNDSCFQVGVIVHELLHVVGLFHEQARCDRDHFVKINLENVENTDEARANFDKKEFQPIGPYDYKSLMHYPRKLFSKDPTLDTITPLNDRVNATGQLDGLSPCDIYKVNKMYSCENRDLESLKLACQKYVNSSWGGEPEDSSICV